MAEIKKIIIDGVKVEGEPLENGRIARNDEGDMLWGKDGVAEQVGEVRYDEDGGLSLEGDNIKPFPDDPWSIPPDAIPIKRQGNGLRHDLSVGHKAYIKELGHSLKNLIRSTANDIAYGNYDERNTVVGNGEDVIIRSGSMPYFDIGYLGEYDVGIPIVGLGEGVEIADADLWGSWCNMYNTFGFYRIIVTGIGYNDDVRIDYAGDSNTSYDEGFGGYNGIYQYDYTNKHYYKNNLDGEWVYDSTNTITGAYTKHEDIKLYKFKRDETTQERATVWNILKNTYVEFKTVTIGEYVDGEWKELSRGSTTLKGSIPEGLNGFHNALRLLITPERTDGAGRMVRHERAAGLSDILSLREELREDIDALIQDEETLSDKTWSSEKIDTFVEVLRTAMNNKFTLIDNKSVLIDNKLVAVDESLAALLNKTNAIINDAVAASISTYSSVKINNLLAALSQSVEVARELAEGARVGIVFDDTLQLDRWLAGTYVRDDGALSGSLKVGESIYIIALNEPDYFWDGTQYHEQETKTDLSGYCTLTQMAALLEDINNLFEHKVDKEAGKGLSTNDYTTAEQTKLADIEAGAQVNAVTSVAGKAGDVTLDSSDVGLGNVDNTSDLNKPISTATQAALDNKADINTNIQQVSLSTTTSGASATILFGNMQILLWKETAANIWSIRILHTDTVAHVVSWTNIRAISTIGYTYAASASIAAHVSTTIDNAAGNGGVGSNITNVFDSTGKAVYKIEVYTQANTAVMKVERIPY